MYNLKWFSGIGWDTSMRDIGWTWLFILISIFFIAGSIIKLIKEW